MFSQSILRSRLLSVSAVCRRNFSANGAGWQSVCKEGTPLNLKVKKSGKEPVALKDEEYPEWLWKLLDEEYQELKLNADPIRKLKKLLRKLNIAKIKLNNFTAKLNG